MLQIPIHTSGFDIFWHRVDTFYIHIPMLASCFSCLYIGSIVLFMFVNQSVFVSFTGIIASGLFLFAIAVLGLIAGSKHHQVLLFFVSLYVHLCDTFIKHLYINFFTGLVRCLKYFPIWCTLTQWNLSRLVWYHNFYLSTEQIVFARL